MTVPNPAILVNGRTFVPLRFVSENFDADVEWQESTDTVIITTASAAPPSSGSGSSSSGSGSSSSGSGSSSGSSSSSGSGSSSGSSSPSTPIAPSGSNSDLYTDYNDAVYWLSRIIEAEAAGESLKGKVAVGEVILNRVRSDEFPNTIWTVIFDTKFGIQFEPVANGSIYNTPSAESIKAAKIALDGSNYVGKCLYFLNPRIAQSNWISKNRVYYTTIGNHDFYL
ncbi:MAG: cell wall hydrolase [Clostridia bacterium]|nr:cell wall hydrolase [Clostridia bacterium]